MTRTYPYTAWTLQPSFKPVAVTLLYLYHSWGSNADWEKSESGKLYNTADLFITKEAAIAAGWERIHAQEAKLAKMQAGIDKKRASLAKAAEAA